MPIYRGELKIFIARPIKYVFFLSIPVLKFHLGWLWMAHSQTETDEILLLYRVHEFRVFLLRI